MTVCGRCGEEVEKAYPLDNGEYAPDNVCEGCIKPWDEVVDV
jgi:hypothetical protein